METNVFLKHFGRLRATNLGWSQYATRTPRHRRANTQECSRAHQESQHINTQDRNHLNIYNRTPCSTDKVATKIRHTKKDQHTRVTDKRAASQESSARTTCFSNNARATPAPRMKNLYKGTRTKAGSESHYTNNRQRETPKQSSPSFGLHVHGTARHNNVFFKCPQPRPRA